VTGHLWIRWWSFGFHNSLRISWPAERLLASQEGLWSEMVCVSSFLTKSRDLPSAICQELNKASERVRPTAHSHCRSCKENVCWNVVNFTIDLFLSRLHKSHFIAYLYENLPLFEHFTHRLDVNSRRLLVLPFVNNHTVLLTTKQSSQWTRKPQNHSFLSKISPFYPVT
jgi:hypothetical protein